MTYKTEIYYDMYAAIVGIPKEIKGGWAVLHINRIEKTVYVTFVVGDRYYIPGWVPAKNTAQGDVSGGA